MSNNTILFSLVCAACDTQFDRWMELNTCNNPQVSIAARQALARYDALSAVRAAMGGNPVLLKILGE